ncbi:MAG: hypothetical protein H8E59_04000 [Actinobacteria bacterium]|nr:hypothetical protein [Actinomycetota bacterium]
MPRTIDRSQPIRRFAKVVAAVDLPGVPEGTVGKVRVANGVSWYRYWVSFDNGIDLGGVSHDQLAQRRDWPQFRIDRESTKLHPDSVGEDAATGEDGADGPATGNSHGVPEHLLERSRLARERLGA